MTFDMELSVCLLNNVPQLIFILMK